MRVAAVDTAAIRARSRATSVGINRRFGEIGEPSGNLATSSCTTTPTTAPHTAPTSASWFRSTPRAMSSPASRATTAHHLDVGALTPGSCGIVNATDAYAEGLQFNAIKIEEEGTRQRMGMADPARQHPHVRDRRCRHAGAGRCGPQLVPSAISRTDRALTGSQMVRGCERGL